jgi:hypothetical protein
MPILLEFSEDPSLTPISANCHHIYSNHDFLHSSLRNLKASSSPNNMAYRPPGLAPVLGLGQVKEQEDDEPSFARFGDLPPELKNIVYKHYCVDLGLISSCEYRYDDQPALLRQSAELRAEALPVFYSHSTFLAEVDIWPPPFEGEVLPATLDKCTKDMMLALAPTHLCRIRHLSLNVELDMEP